MALVESSSLKKRKHDALLNDNDDDDASSSSDTKPKTLHIVVRRVGKSEKDSLKVQLLTTNATVSDLKESITKALADCGEAVIPHERQRLIFSGKMLRDDSQSLETDLKMTAGEQKHFVHLTPLPKGAAPSVRTERELSDNPSQDRNRETMRRIAARRRRRQPEQPRGIMDPAAYHPYALDLASGSLLPRSTSASATTAAAAAANTDASTLLSVAVAAAEQSRLAQEVAARGNVDAVLQAVVLAQQQQQQQQQQNQLLAAAAAAGGGTTAAAALANALCPLVGQAVDSAAAASLLESTLLGAAHSGPSVAPATTAALLRYVAPEAGAAEAIANSPAAASLLQELMMNATAAAPAPPTTANGNLAEILDQIAANAGELATTLRLLSPQQQAEAASAGLLLSSPATATTPAVTAALLEQLSAPQAAASLIAQLTPQPSSLMAPQNAAAAALLEQVSSSPQNVAAAILEQVQSNAATANTLTELSLQRRALEERIASALQQPPPPAAGNSLGFFHF